MNSNLAENLKKIRKENNLSQEDLADILGVSRQAISKWESKVSYPEMDKIVLLCKKFDLNIDDLLHKDIKEVKESVVVQNKRARAIIQTVVAITEPKGDRRNCVVYVKNIAAASA